MDKSAIKRFEEKYMPVTESGCWIWIGCIKSDGYGNFFYNSKMTGAHRASWMIFNGDIPNKMYVLHKCDSPLCVNPDHLFLGAQKDNIQDMVKKGRQNRIRPEVTHCKRGHKFTPENSMKNGRNSGKKTCRICANERAKKYQLKETEG